MEEHIHDFSKTIIEMDPSTMNFNVKIALNGKQINETTIDVANSISAYMVNGSLCLDDGWL